jgi:hypothetical protein
MRDKKIPSLTTWKKYVRGFIPIGGWLEQANKLTSEEYASYFWEGINKRVRAKIKSRLMAREPDRDLSLAFPVDKVVATAEKLLHRDRFDADLLVSDVDSDTDSDTSSEESSESSSDSDSSDSEQELFLKNPKARERYENKRENKKLKHKKTKETKVKASQQNLRVLKLRELLP